MSTGDIRPLANVSVSGSAAPPADLTMRIPGITYAGAIALLVFAALCPPFLYTPDTPEGRVVRLLFEGLMLIVLGFQLTRTGGTVFVAVFVAMMLYLVNYLVSGELIDNVVSYFNKLALLMLLAGVLRRKPALAAATANVWVAFWTYCSMAAVIAYVLFLSRIVSPAHVEGIAHHIYFTYPLIGNFLFKATDSFSIPRYSGFLGEPVELGLFFGMNVLLASSLIREDGKRRTFVRLNLVAGALTMSYAYALFLVALLVLRLRIVARVASSKPVVIALVATATIGGLSALVAIHEQADTLLPFSSLSERLGSYILSVDFLRQASAAQWLFGAGIVPFHDAIGGGASAGIIDVLASRGIIITLVWIYVLRRMAAPISGMFAYIMLYALILDYWHFPLFIIGLVTAATHANETRASLTETASVAI